jgi:hypothetical protein
MNDNINDSAYHNMAAKYLQLYLMDNKTNMRLEYRLLKFITTLQIIFFWMFYLYWFLLILYVVTFDYILGIIKGGTALRRKNGNL